MNDKVNKALEKLKPNAWDCNECDTKDCEKCFAYNTIKSALQHNNVSRKLQLELKRLKGDIEISKIEEVGLYNKYDGKQSNPKGHLLQHIEKIEELLSITQPKTLQQRQEEIIAELNEHYRQYGIEDVWHIKKSVEVITITDGDVEISYNKKWNRLFNGDFYHGLPIELAHKITSYFMAIKRVDEEIAVNRNEEVN